MQSCNFQTQICKRSLEEVLGYWQLSGNMHTRALNKPELLFPQRPGPKS